MKSKNAFVPYVQDLSGFFDSGALNKTSFQKRLKDTFSVVQSLKTKGENAQLDMLDSAFWTKDMDSIKTAAEAYQGLRHVLIIGMGGATLGSKALVSLYQSWVMVDSSAPFLYFLDNLDAEIFWELMSVLNPKETGLIVVSKSGETAETLTLCMRCLDYWGGIIPLDTLAQRITMITAPGSALEAVGLQHKAHILYHPPSIGGRFSCFTAVAFLPLMIVQGHPLKVRKGASKVIQSFFSDKNSAPLQGATALFMLYKQGKSDSVMMAYGQAFMDVLSWNRQLVGESLGKNDQGFTPLVSLCPMDQHSQLQLYLDGPKKKHFTFFSEKKRPQESLTPQNWSFLKPMHTLSRSTIHDVQSAQEEATWKVLVQKGLPARRFVFPVLNDCAMGALMAHMMLEVLVLAEMMEVNALDQPAVEAIKLLTHRFLKERLKKATGSPPKSAKPKGSEETEAMKVSFSQDAFPQEVKLEQDEIVDASLKSVFKKTG